MAGEAYQQQLQADQQREQLLQGPQATEERAASQDAYLDSDSPSEVTALLHQQFAPELASLDDDPARALDDLTIKKLYDAHTALVSDGGAPGLIDSRTPLRAVDDTGQSAPVDLSLSDQGNQFTTDNGLVDTSLPAQSDDAVDLGSQLSFSIASAGSETAAGQPFGDKAVIYPNGAGTDTDLLLAPVSGGVDVLSQIRSPESPDRYQLNLDPPANSTVAQKPDGSVEVERGGARLAVIRPSKATDAQGQDVPSHLEVDGTSVSVVTDYKGGDYAFPILTDPVVDTFDWGSGSQISTGWAFAADNHDGSGSCFFTGAFYYGALAYAPGGCYYKNSTWGQWLYYPPGQSTFITTATFNPISFSDSCNINASQVAEPHGYLGVYRRTDAAGWRSLFTFGPPVPAQQINTYPGADFGSPLDVAVAGLGTPQVGGDSSYPNWCQRTLYFQGAAITMSDPESPTVGALTHTGISYGSTGWTDSTESASVSFHVTDPGLGVYGTAVIYPKAGGNWAGSSQLVSGPGISCTATPGAPCPSDYDNPGISYPLSDFPEGVATANVWAWDPLWWYGQDNWNGVTHLGSEPFDVRVDRTAPRITSTSSHVSTGGSGQTLHVEASDAKLGNDELAVSGVRSVRVTLGSSTTPAYQETIGCATTGTLTCPKTVIRDIPLTAQQLASADVKTAHVQVRDQLDHLVTSDLPLDTVAPETTITGGPTGVTSSRTSTFTYTSSEGGSTVECSLEPASATTPVFRSCPSGSYTTSQLADGRYVFSVRATDATGNTDATPATRAFSVGPQLTATGPLVDLVDPLVGTESAVDVHATDAGGRGVTSITISIDQNASDALAQACPNGGCELGGPLLPSLAGLSPGHHDFKIIATDAAGYESAPITGTFTLDPIEPQISVTGPLPSSDGAEMTSDTLSASISATDSASGDAGIAKVEVRVDGDLAATQTASCSSACPSTYSSTYTYDRRNWPPGQHEIVFTAFDRAGNIAESSSFVNTPNSMTAQLCPATTPTTQPAPTPYDATQAKGAALTGAYAPSVPPSTPDPISGDTLAPELEQDNFDATAPFDAGDSYAEGSVGSRPASGFGILDELCMVPRQTTASESVSVISHQTGDEANPVAVDAAIYPNSATDTDTVVRPTAFGVTAVQSIRGTSAPTSYSWNLGIASGLQVQALAAGGLAIYDPSVAAPNPLSVPTRPDDAEAAASIPKVATQTSEGRYEIANAEREIGKLVYAVIARPYGVDTSGNTQAATLSYAGGVITATPPPGAKALVLSVFDDPPGYHGPDPVGAYYISYKAPNAVVDVTGDRACSYRQNARQDQNRRLVFNFGTADKENGSYGVKLDFGTNPFISNGVIINALDRAVTRFRDPACQINSGVHVSIGYGATNQNIETFLSASDAQTHGDHMQGVLNVVERDKSIGINDPIHLSVAEDTEAWGDPTRTHDWVQGSLGSHRVVDYGTAGGCQPTGDCRGDWTTSQFAFVSQGTTNHRIVALPEIYHAFQIGNWRAVQAQWNDGHLWGPVYMFGGVTSIVDACPGLTAQESYGRFHRKVPRLGVELIQFSCPYAGIDN